MPPNNFLRFHSSAMALALLCFPLAGHSRGDSDCRAQTTAVAAMPEISATLDSTPRRLLLADTPRARAAGMQWLCPEAIADQPMLFVFPRPRSARFHGNNVFGDLDLAWIDEGGTVIKTVRLPRGGEVSTREPAAAVLEAAAGSFRRWGIVAGSQLRLQPDLATLAAEAR